MATEHLTVTRCPPFLSLCSGFSSSCSNFNPYIHIFWLVTNSLSRIHLINYSVYKMQYWIQTLPELKHYNLVIAVILALKQTTHKAAKDWLSAPKHTLNGCQTTVWQGTCDGVGVLYPQQRVWLISASLWCSFCCWKAEVDIPALSVESLLYLDLGLQGCPGTAGYRLNHTLISPPCTLCRWINNAISVKQLLLYPPALTFCPSLVFWCCSLPFCKQKSALSHTRIVPAGEDIKLTYIHSLDVYVNPNRDHYIPYSNTNLN